MKYHLIGDQGISMRGVKKILESEGHIVTGSDLKTGGHSSKNITKDVDVVVRTSAVSFGSPGWVEVKKAESLKIPVKKRSEIIGEITKDKYLIAISGMHGKTTTTALIGLAMEKAGLDPTILVGEEVEELKGVVRIGGSKYFVLEACEYDKSFYDFKPDVAVVTNLDLEHIDTFPKGWIDIETAFLKYFENIKENGALIFCGDDRRLKKLSEEARRDIKIIQYQAGKRINTSLMGFHNQSNIYAAIAVMDYLQVDYDRYSEIFTNFGGAKRRLEYRGEIKGMKVYDDYGHHPTEIAATISALREKYLDKKILTIFWPHQYKRIEFLKKEFAKSLSLSDMVILKPIYFVPGRDEVKNIKSENISELIYKNGVTAEVVENDNDIVEKVLKQLNGDWVILTLGIPPVYKIADLLMSEKEKK